MQLSCHSKLILTTARKKKVSGFSPASIQFFRCIVVVVGVAVIPFLFCYLRCHTRANQKVSSVRPKPANHIAVRVI